MKLKLREPDKEDRLARLKKRKVDLDGLHPNLYPVVVEDFLDLQYPNKKLLKVAKTFKYAMYLQRLLPQNPKAWLVPTLENANVANVQETQALVANLVATSKRNLELGRAVFFQLWHVIAKWLPRGHYSNVDLEAMMKNCNEVFSFTDRRHICWELSSRDLRAQIAFELEAENDGDQDYNELFKGPVFSELWDLVKKYPSHPAHQKGALKARIVEFLQQKKDGALATVLKDEFTTHGVTMRSDSNFIKDFNLGKICCSPEQVVATLYLSSQLMSYSHRAWSQLRHRYENQLKETVYSRRTGWMDTVKQITSASEFASACRSVPTYSYTPSYSNYSGRSYWKSRKYYRRSGWSGRRKRNRYDWYDGEPGCG
ncbi:hypothetical protein HDU96_007774 [Phlyctochytrium bullatum]|nr:hypothetical protein HDU96_007774 [Phlyctochytrium bullatum]